jgi:hypothetical protein
MREREREREREEFLFNHKVPYSYIVLGEVSQFCSFCCGEWNTLVFGMIGGVGIDR